MSAPLVLPFHIEPELLAALRRFYECALDGEGYDVPASTMKVLAAIGLLNHRSAGHYETSEFGLAVLNNEFAQPVQQPAAVVGQEPFGYVATQSTAAGTIFHMSRVLREKHDAQTCADAWEAGRHKANDHRIGVLPLYTAPVPAAGVQGGTWRDALRRSGANTDYHGLIAFTGKQLEHFVQLLDQQTTVQPNSGQAGAQGDAVTYQVYDGTNWVDVPKEQYDRCNKSYRRELKATTVQPDSGRDAALVAELRSVYSIYNGHGEDLRDLADRAADRITTLAAHPAPSSDAALVEVWHTSLPKDRAYLDARTSREEAMLKEINALRLAAHPANGAQAGDAALLGALADVLYAYDFTTCTHEATKRAGAIWTVCEDCGKTWADNRGGFKPYKDSPKIAAARSILAAAKKGTQS